MDERFDDEDPDDVAAADEEKVAAKARQADERLEQNRANLQRARETKAALRGMPERDLPSRGDVSGTDRTGHNITSKPDPIRDSYAQSAHNNGEVFTRKRRDERQLGMLDVPVHMRKPGWDYQYVTITVLNQPVDRSAIRDFTDNGGWRPVLARDMPELAEENAAGDSYIEMQGARLYNRPMSLTQEAKTEDYRTAIEQQRSRTQAAASGGSSVLDGIPTGRGMRRVPLEVQIYGEVGS